MEFKNDEQLEKARLEDVLVSLLYDKYKGLVFHGGTAIWRCYSGNRFSRDIDFYLGAEKDKRTQYREFAGFLKDRGFTIKEKGYDGANGVMHFLVESTTKMKVDINLKRKEGSPAEYVKVDGSRMVVLSLTPEELLEEKIDAYEDKLRGQKSFREPEVQDLYDIYHLTTVIKSGRSKTVGRLRALVKEIENNPPPNLRSLDHLILSGVAPTFDFMIGRIKKWANDA